MSSIPSSVEDDENSINSSTSNSDSTTLPIYIPIMDEDEDDESDDDEEDDSYYDAYMHISSEDDDYSSDGRGRGHGHDNNSSRSDDNISSNESYNNNIESSDNQQQEGGGISSANNNYPAARQHTYLPGVTNPLFPEQWLQSTTTSSPQPPTSASASNNNNISTLGVKNSNGSYNDYDTTIPILQLDGVVLFPNSTLPLRLTHRSWVRYLSRQIAFARDGRLTDATNNGEMKQEYKHIGNSNINAARSRETRTRNQVRIGVVTRLHSTRRSWRIRRRARLSQNIRNGMNDDGNVRGEENEDTSTSQNQSRGGRMGRWNINLVRRGILRQPSSRTYHQDDDDDYNDDNDSNEADIDIPLHERVLHQHQTIRDDPLIGRIGTFATITYTHENENNNTGEIIVTALSTGRFRIIQSASDVDTNGHNNIVDPNECKMYHVQELLDDLTHVPNFIIKQKKPQSNYNHGDNSCTSASTKQNSNNMNILDDGEKDPQSSLYHNAHQMLIQHLSRVTCIPVVAYHKIWPWRLAEDIVKEIQSNDTFNGLWKSLPLSSGRCKIITSIDNFNNDGNEDEDKNIQSRQRQTNDNETQYAIDRSHFDPISFSFWIAANLPLSETHKLDLLEMNNVVERLRFILASLVKQREISGDIRCKQCGSTIAKMDDLFTVGGAEGTTGAYVNEHGVIHQTISIRNLVKGSIMCIGGEETRDSWFPGYSWTITYCVMCSSHLGWKFKIINGNSSKDRPPMFWGISGSNVTTAKARPRRININIV